MFSLLIAIIYVSFISLGLPDSLLGSAWPIMHLEMDAPISYAGIVSMIISGSTIVSSLLSDKLTRKLGAGLVTACSVFLTAGALLGFSLSPSFAWLCVFAVPYGLGAGAVDAALNNYVAVHYSARHMSWLHCFWGVGATIGPYIMSFAISAGHGWRAGYGIISAIQIVLTLTLFLTLPIWKRSSADAQSEDYEAPLGITDAVRIRGVKALLTAFLCYCAFEATAGLWASSYLAEYRDVDAETAASFASLFYLGITAGRFVSGFIADRIGDKNMIRIGLGIIFTGLLCIVLPVKTPFPALMGLVIIGIGAAPVYPSIIHSTPSHFGKENSHAIVGIQMASAYVGSTFVPPLFGLIARYAHIAFYPLFMTLFILFTLFMTEKVNKLCK